MKKVHSLPRTKLNYLVKYLTGHCQLKKKLCDMQESDDPSCRLCEDHLETPYHVLIECEALEIRRNIIHANHVQIYNSDIINYKKRRRWDTEYKKIDIYTIDLFLDMIFDFAKLFD